MVEFTLRDSRRLTGPNIIGPHAGPVVDLALNDKDANAMESIWRSRIQPLLDGLNWSDSVLTSRHFPGGLSLSFSAPMDVLYTACEMNEWALAETEDLASSVEHFKQSLRKEANPPLIRLKNAATREGSLFLACDDFVSIGAGRWSKTWSVKELPEAAEVDMKAHLRIPTAMITGTNGKTTTVRLLKSMVDAQGKVPGLSSTDWLMVGDKIIDQGDWSGPGGARNILRNERVDIALLETARGGMLRRGLALGPQEADVVLINNIAADHLGEWGIQDLDMLADTKFVIRHAGRHVVLNAEDEKSVERRHWVDQPLTWFSLDPTLPWIIEHEVAGGKSATLRKGQLCWTENGQCTNLVSVHEVPMTLGGAAKHNIANALAAISVAKELGISEESISEGLRSFLSNPKDNPGRMNRFDVGGVSVFVDFAHNPHGLAALLEMTAALPAKRRLVTLGHAGDRNDENLIALAQTAAASALDCILIKEQPGNLRGREIGEVTEILKKSLLSSGYPEAKILHADDELQATEMALDWAKPGDLLLLLTLDRRADVLRLVQMAQQK